MFQFIDLFFLEVSTQWVFGLMSHLEACVHSAYLFVPRHTVIHSISLSFLCCYLSLSSPFFCPSTIGPGQYPEETLDLDVGPPVSRLDWAAFKHGSCYGSRGSWWWWLCVCFRVGVVSCGSSRKTQLWPLLLLLLRPSPRGVGGE